MGYNKALGLKLDGMTGRKRVEQNVEGRNYIYDGLYVMLKFGFYVTRVIGISKLILNLNHPLCNPCTPILGVVTDALRFTSSYYQSTLKVLEPGSSNLVYGSKTERV